MSSNLSNQKILKTIYQFLHESLRNQEKISIGTDLKHECGEAIGKLKVKQHFCKFHVKQNINKRFKDYFDKNQLEKEDFNELIDLKS